MGPEGSPRSPGLFVGGAGKTALLLRAAEELAAREGARLVVHVCRPGDSIAAVAQRALTQVGEAAPAGPQALGALLASAHAAPLILCLDDAHHAAEPALVDGIVALALRRAPLWLVAASREALGIEPSA